MSKLWSGRFAASGAQLLDEFNASLPFDKKLYAEDIKGSIAHATMLAKQGILTQAEADQIATGLLQIKQEIEEGTFVFDIAEQPNGIYFLEVNENGKISRMKLMKTN